jgi:antitoxin component YwqK of YwqJK toxin-antitoxin module
MWLAVSSKLSFAQTLSADTLNQLHSTTGLRQGYWVISNALKKLPDYSENAKVEEGRYEEGKKIGVWKTYYPNGNIKSEITYTNNRPKGYAKMYYENGKMQEEGIWENNRWVGDYKAYHSNGQLFYDFAYNNTGKREGQQKYYYENGQMMMKGEMKDGKEAGVWEEHYENGDLRAKKVFNEGALDAESTEVYAPKKPIKEEPSINSSAKMVDIKMEQVNAAQTPFTGNGYAKLFLPGSKIAKDGEFKNYRLINGKDYLYSVNGILERIAVYKNGKYVGDSPIEEKDK